MQRSEIETLVQGFMAETVKHKLQEQAHEAVSFACNDDPSSAIIVLAGPTGVGKSTLLSKFADEYLLERAAAMATDATLRPIAYTVSVASGHKGFDWKRLFKDAGRNLGDPFAYRRDHCGPRKDRPNKRAPLTRLAGESLGASVMREELEAELELRGCGMWIIDEAHHVIRGARKGGPGDQLDVLKSLAQTSRARLLLCGTYDLPDYMLGSGQLSRRSSVIRFNRYRWTDPDERRVFANVVRALLKRLPYASRHPDVKENLQFFYLHSLGCIGIFKDWAARALALQLRRGDAALTIEHFRQTRLPAKKLAVINQEVIDGESRYSDDSEEPDETLKRSILHGVAVVKRRTTSPAAGRAAASGPPKRSAKTHRVGERTPGRDLVGPAQP